MGMILLWFAKFPQGIPRQYGDLNLLAQGSCGLEWPTLGARRRFGNRSAGGADCLISTERRRQSTFEWCPGEIRERHRSPFWEPVQADPVSISKRYPGRRDRSTAG